jgi:hypothetical protein
MVMRWISLAISVLAAAACGDDTAGGAGQGTEGTASGDDGGGTAMGDDGLDETSTPDDGGPACASDDECDDADPCTIDACDAGGSCTHAPIEELTAECRPAVEVEYPPRAATVLGASGDPSVVVQGHVTSGMGPIASLTINGESATVADDGTFAHAIEASAGGNLLVLEATDVAGFGRKRVQSFLWSTAFDLPTVPGDGMAPEGLALWLGQESIDDGDRTPPLDDVASLLQIVFDGFDVSTLFDPETPIANYAGYDIYITDLTIGEHTVGLAAVDGGLALTANIDDVLGDLLYDCTTPACVLAGGDSTGGFSVVTLQVNAQLQLAATADHQLQAQLVGVDVVLAPDDVEVWSDNAWTDFLISVVEVFVHDQLVAEFESALEQTIQEDFGPILTEGLSQLALGLSFDFPNLGNAREPIVVDFVADFADTDFHDGAAPPAPSPAQGGAVILRGGGYPSAIVAPYTNDGVPRRSGCGTGDDAIAIAAAAPFEIVLADDLLNQLLHAGWRGGLLEFPLTSEQLGGGGEGGGLVEDFEVQVSGMLAPTASDCTADGKLRATIGDIRIDAELTVLDKPVTFVAYTTLVAGLDVTATDEGIQIALAEVERVETELTANDDAIDLEPTLVESLEDQLVDGLLGELGGLGTFALPEVDLGGLLGLPPGEAVLHIHVQGADRQPGSTVISAHL